MIIVNNSDAADEAPYGTITLLFETQAERDQAEVLVEALGIYAGKNPKYNDNWIRMGYRGCLVRIRERAERLWDQFWDGPTQICPDQEKVDVDDALDLINFAGFFVRGIRSEATRDGQWWGRKVGS